MDVHADALRSLSVKKMLEDKGQEMVDLIAERLGLERIGWILTGLPRDELLTADEVSQAHSPSGKSEAALSHFL